MEPKIRPIGWIPLKILRNSAKEYKETKKGPPMIDWRAIYHIFLIERLIKSKFARADLKFTRAIFFK